jgi:hypothetical protein
MVALVESMSRERDAKALVGNMKALLSALVRKYYLRGAGGGGSRSGRSSPSEIKHVIQIFNIINDTALPTIKDLGTLANLAETASYFDYRKQTFWQNIVEKVMHLLVKENQNMNLVQVSQLLRGIAYTNNANHEFEDKFFDELVKQLK